MIALVVVTDGRREYLARTVASLRENLRPWPGHRYMVDDSGDATYSALLADAYGGDFEVHSHFGREGFVATVKDAWQVATKEAAVEYVAYAEDDFTYNVPVDLEHMMWVLDRNPHLAQLALKRQPVNSDERAAGDITRVFPGEWQQRPTYTEHTRNFTTNPCLIPRRVIQLVLRAKADTAEMALTWFLQGQGYTFGFVGDLDDAPRVHHIGEHRSPGARYP